MGKLNIYQVKGKYRLWKNETLPTEGFSRSVLAESVDDSIVIIKEQYSDAVIESVMFFIGDVLVRQKDE